MTEAVNNCVIAIYDDAPHAMLDFESLVAFDTNVPFDAAVAAKSATGEVELQGSHHAPGSAKVSHGVGAGLAAGVLVSMLPGIGLAAAAGGAAAGGAIEARKNVKVRHESRDQFLKIANDALDDGEAVLAIVCAPSEAERFDKLLTDARRVPQVDVSQLEG